MPTQKRTKARAPRQLRAAVFCGLLAQLALKTSLSFELSVPARGSYTRLCAIWPRARRRSSGMGDTQIGINHRQFYLAAFWFVKM